MVIITMKRALITLLKGYKLFISPSLPPCCRYYPTCSQYAIDAITKYGIMKGIVLAVWRLLRCHPFAKGGIDQVR
jgi:uncharacterized protein